MLTKNRSLCLLWVEMEDVDGGPFREIVSKDLVAVQKELARDAGGGLNLSLLGQRKTDSTLLLTGCATPSNDIGVDTKLLRVAPLRGSITASTLRS